MSNEILLKELYEKTACVDLPLKDSATNLVFGKGNPDAKIMFIGEAPGKDEDLQGIPFVGRAGKELDGLLSTIGLSLSDVYIANILKYRPPENRDPNTSEIRAHTPFLIEQIRVVKPAVICTLGNYATKFVLGGFDPDGMKKVSGITQLHGREVEVAYDEMSITVMPLYHPAAMLYRPQLRDVLEEDMQRVGEIVKGRSD